MRKPASQKPKKASVKRKAATLRGGGQRRLLIGGVVLITVAVIGAGVIWRALDQTADLAFSDPGGEAVVAQEPDTARAMRPDGSAMVAPERDWQSGYNFQERENPNAPTWQRHSVPMPKTENRAMIAIVMDDMGLNGQENLAVMELPAPLTLAYLPYGENVQAQVDDAKRRGHEILLHLPMEPSLASADPGPNALLTSYDQIELLQRIDWNLRRFTGYVGVNNHMGSRFTQDAEAMTAVIDVLKSRGLLYLDSLTSPHSIAYDLARQEGVAAAKRHVFLDHEDDSLFIAGQIAATERIAKRQGFAIAIGHPRPRTLNALAGWLPGLRENGFILVPVSTIIHAIIYQQSQQVALPKKALAEQEANGIDNK